MKKPYSVGYFSSYDRGLECLLNMWPEIKKQVPEATLDIYYGWNTFDSVHKNNPEQMKWKWSIIRKINELDGVSEHGRVDHQTLAKKMREIQVWAYPTEFTEIHCITALKAQEAGCIPVTTNVAALEETVTSDKYMVYTDKIYSDTKSQDLFVTYVCKALKDSKYTHKLHPNRYWADVADVWHEAMA